MRVALIFVPLWILAVSVQADVVSNLSPFFSEHCYDCHDESVSKGDLDLTALLWEPWDPETAVTLIRILERVESGEMPPKKKARPEQAELDKFLTQLGQPLEINLKNQQKRFGRVAMRRLTPWEYQNTLRDLLGVNRPLSVLLPAENDAPAFEKVASVQQTSHFHLTQYLEAADLALTQAFAQITEGEVTYRKEVTPALQTKPPKRGNHRGPELINKRSVTWRNIKPFFGRMPETRVPEEGFYRITIKDVQGVNPRNGSVWGLLQRGFGDAGSATLSVVGLIEGGVTPQTLVFETWMAHDEQLILYVADVTADPIQHSGWGGNIFYKGKFDRVALGSQGIANRGITVERIRQSVKTEDLKQILFGDLTPERWQELANQPKQRLEALDQQINAFAQRAFRRPVPWDALHVYRRLAQEELAASDGDLVATLQAAYSGILCSPRFLTLNEEPGELDDHALASRLSYLLWGSCPDETLIDLADKQEFSKSDVLTAQIERLLKDSKSKRFMRNFGDQWLDLDDINFTVPDRKLYPRFDDTVQESMLQESRAFVEALLRDDLPVVNIVKSDFGFLNERLVRFYQLEDEVKMPPGTGIQKVAIPEGARSGIVTQGAVLKVTADGTVTSPIVRGVWMNERILGRHIPPPPPGIPAVEPDIRGAIGIREQLDKHRSNESCSACHAKFDPAGFALEAFDPIGLVRFKYGRGANAARIDPSGVTPEGEAFDGLRQWQDIYAAQPERLARNFTNHLITYATGEAPGFADREAVDHILAEAANKNYGAKSLLLGVIQSEIFRHK